MGLINNLLSQKIGGPCKLVRVHVMADRKLSLRSQHRLRRQLSKSIAEKQCRVKRMHREPRSATTDFDSPSMSDTNADSSSMSGTNADSSSLSGTDADRVIRTRI